MRKLVDTYVVLGRPVVETGKQRQFGKNHHPAQVPETNHAKNISMVVSIRLELLPEGIRVDENLTQTMVFPILEPKDGDHSAGSDQEPNRVINIGSDASDPNLIEKNLDELPKSFFSRIVQGSKKRDVRQENGECSQTKRETVVS
jgi:hypothetical protein